MRDFITYYNIVFQNYLNISYTRINSPTRSRRYLTAIARAIFKINDNIKKRKKEIYSITLDTLTVNSSLALSTDHSILSPIFTSIIAAIVDGSVVLTELFVTEPLLNLVFCLNNNTITSIMFFFIIIYIVTTIYIFLDKTTLKKVTFIYYHNQNVLLEANFKSCNF